MGVNFGDTPEQLKAGKEYSGKLTGKKSYAVILNFIVQSKFELVQTLEYTEAYSGTAGLRTFPCIRADAGKM